MKKVILMIILICFTFRLNAATHELVKVAEQAYEAVQYDLAAQTYSKLDAKYPKNAGLLYALGNFYFQKMELGKAICFYKRALLVSPREGDIRSNLSLAESLVGISSGTKFDRFFWWNVEEGIWVLLLVFSFTNVLSLAYHFGKKTKVLFRAFCLCLSLCVVCLGMLSLKLHATFFEKKGIIIDKQVSLKTGANEQSGFLYTLHEGDEVRKVMQQGEYSRVKLGNGVSGWIATKTIWTI